MKKIDSSIDLQGGRNAPEWVAGMERNIQVLMKARGISDV